MKLLKLLFLVSAIYLINTNCYGQLKKTGSVEKVKSFTYGSVLLTKSTVKDSIEIYSVVLGNNSKYYDNIVLWLGTKEEMLNNLTVLSLALKDGKEGDVYEFSACGYDYHLSYLKRLGSVSFKVRNTHSTSDDYGCFQKITIDDILEYMQNM